jgi:hypothetical protein
VVQQGAGERQGGRDRHAGGWVSAGRLGAIVGGFVLGHQGTCDVFSFFHSSATQKKLCSKTTIPRTPIIPSTQPPFAEHVRKLKGGKPGQVLLAKEDRVVVVRPHDSLAAAGEGEP